ncbi:MAG: AI-2E family transporter [Proteobacteria bacterium]|nr:AI-2E family transporter [Pseudomonadota bacterium]
MSSTPPPLTPQMAQVMNLVRVLLVTLVVVLAYFVLSYLAGVLAPILAALGIAYLLNPLLERLVARGMRRSIGASLLLVTFVGFVVGVVIVLAPRAAVQISEFLRDLPRMIDNLSAWTRSNLGMEIHADWKAVLHDPKTRASLGDSSGPLRVIAAAAVGGIFQLLAALAEVALVPVFAFYFLVDWPNILRRLDHMIPPRRRGEVREVAREIDRVVAGWVRGQAIVTSILAVCYAIAFSIVGMPLSLPIGLLVGGLTVIPFVGTLVGAAIAAMVTIANGSSMEMLGAVGGVILVLHLFEAGVLTPKIVGHRVGLSESGALLAVVAGGKLLGFVGVVLAVPIAATVAVLVRYLVKFYERSAFFGHETDADVVITPAMALIMPGIKLGAKIVVEAPPDTQLEPHISQVPAATEDDWSLAPDAVSTIALGAPGPSTLELEGDDD